MELFPPKAAFVPLNSVDLIGGLLLSNILLSKNVVVSDKLTKTFQDDFF